MARSIPGAQEQDSRRTVLPLRIHLRVPLPLAPPLMRFSISLPAGFPSPIHYPAPTHLRVRSAPPLHRRRCPAVPRRAQRRAVHYSAVYIPARPRGAKPRHAPRCRPPTRPGSLELGHSCRIAAACRQGTARLVRDRGCPWRARTGNFRAFKNSTRSKVRNSARSDIRTGRISACHIGRLGVARCLAPSKFKIQTLHAG